MSGHFAAIGFAYDDQESFRASLAGIGAGATEVARSARAIHAQWLDPSGASVAFHIDIPSSDLVCVTPFFAPPEPSTWQVRSSRPLDDTGCAHCGGAVCDVLGPDGEVVVRTCIQWVAYQPYREWLRTSRSYALEVVAFARSVEVFADPRAAEAQAQGRMGDTDFEATGLLSGSDDLAQAAIARFAGRVHAAAMLSNAHTGGRFWRLRVDAPPGVLDVVASDASMIGEPAAGHHVLVDAWLVGRPAEPPPAPKRSLWRRLTG